MAPEHSPPQTGWDSDIFVAVDFPPRVCNTIKQITGLGRQGGSSLGNLELRYALDGNLWMVRRWNSAHNMPAWSGKVHPRKTFVSFSFHEVYSTTYSGEVLLLGQWSTDRGGVGGVQENGEIEDRPEGSGKPGTGSRIDQGRRAGEDAEGTGGGLQIFCVLEEAQETATHCMERGTRGCRIAGGAREPGLDVKEQADTNEGGVVPQSEGVRGGGNRDLHYGIGRCSRVSDEAKGSRLELWRNA
ncbi:hypothetical protein BDZ91DRAFT_765214 [Kalaharituber pfeilii]|nr:hypothetical protein BDZ91DRAFT_765214 [Kalaharituber pfeilii]